MTDVQQQVQAVTPWGRMTKVPASNPCRNIKLRYLFFYWAPSQKLHKGLIESSCPSVRPTALSNSVPIGRISMKSDIGGFFENLS
jgi:hypothetical protein